MNRLGKSDALAIAVVLTAFLALVAPTSGQQVMTTRVDEPVIVHLGQRTDLVKPTGIQKQAGHYTRKDWRRLIDSLWGPGLATPTKLAIFDRYWGLVDSNFACFNNLVINWDSLRTVYRTEIESTVSRGRFAAIVAYLGYALTEMHTGGADRQVCTTYPHPGVPLLVNGGWAENSHFGAGLTPLPDSSLLVYRVVANHPLGLQRGDIVLGYDRRPWRILYKELISYQLPLATWSWYASSDTTMTHAFLMSAGLNWHLFDTIDVVKYSTRDTVHYPTFLLDTTMNSLYCTEQMDIPGVPMPNISGGQYVSYGIWTGTQIGYIYGWGWAGNAETEFFNSLNDLTNNPSLKGLIIDFRYNRGGDLFLSNRGLQLLFKDTTRTIASCRRRDPRNHAAMFVIEPPQVYAIPGNGVKWYDKPIAVLAGPGCVSSGDQVAFRTRLHPTAKVFGMSTNTAFIRGYVTPSVHPDFYFQYAYSEACLASDTTSYMTHRNIVRQDVPVWLTADDVARGDDTVAKRAKAWIDSVTAVAEEPGPTPVSADRLRLRVYPNPVKGRTTIELMAASASSVSASIFNAAGQNIVTLTSGKVEAGTHLMHLSTRDIPGGVYFCCATSGSKTSIVKMVVVR